jgi:hypothetical protein
VNLKILRILGLAAAGWLAFVASPGLLISRTPDDISRTGIVDARALKLFATTQPNATAAAINLANISTRLAVGSGDNVLIAGFIITGSQPKKVVLRGLGPLLPVNENLADPTLELHRGPDTLASNDNWRDTQEDAVKATTIPPINDYDSALVQTLDPGTYTVILAGKGGTTGVGLVELYDLDLGANSKLANISTRGVVGQDDNVLIAGTIVVGSGSTTILFRAIGPSLQLGGKLLDPTLELYNGQGQLLEANDNWGDSPNRQAIIDTTIPPNDPREAAILRPLTPGAYTAILRGKNNTTGVAVVEAYQIN